MIYLGTKNGLNTQSFWKEVNEKTNLLMIFKSKSDYIFGAYSPCKWICNRGDVIDDTFSSFIFSQTHDQVYPLKQDTKERAIHCHANYGPVFGDGNDIEIHGDFSNGKSRLGHTYYFDQYKNRNDDPHLYGQIRPEIKELEIYELQFI